jgi:hypothetical protein
MSLRNKKLLIKEVRAILEGAHGAGDPRTGREGQGANDMYSMGYADTGIYPTPPTTLADADELCNADDDEFDETICAPAHTDDDIVHRIASVTNGGPSINIDHGRAPLTLSSPISEAPRMRSAGYPSNSLGMVTPASRALNSPKSVRATIKTGKGTAMGGSNTQINARRPTGSTRDFSAGAQDLNQSALDEPVYDLSDILVHKDDERGNIDKIKKLTWILQNSDE